MFVLFRYKLVPGASKQSFGMHCAVSAGVPVQVMVRASEVSNLISAKQVSQPREGMKLVNGGRRLTWLALVVSI
jgi:DNA mismatch repair ATPase MutS